MSLDKIALIVKETSEKDLLNHIHLLVRVAQNNLTDNEGLVRGDAGSGYAYAQLEEASHLLRGYLDKKYPEDHAVTL